MGQNKNKALESELLDDLLEGRSSVSKVKSPESDEIQIEGYADASQLPSSLDSDATVPNNEPSFTQKSESEIHQNQTFNLAEPEKTAHSEDPTIRLPETKSIDQPIDPLETKPSRPSTPSQTAHVSDDVRSSVGRFKAFRNTSTPAGAALAQSETLRIAQGRILELEQEIDRIRTENESLAAAGEMFRRKADEMSSRLIDLDSRYHHATSSFEEEKKLLLETRDSLRDEVHQLKDKNSDLESRIATNIQKIRVRERELENRLELVKMEGSALVRSKDELILDLKRQIDQLNLELGNYRTKNQELNRVIQDKQDILRRTVKALRLALTMLEGEEDAAPPQKKAK